MTMPPPNNYPREGDHNTVTTEGVQWLERQRLQHNFTVDYTIGGAVETDVHATIEAEREYAITQGHRALNQASQNMRDRHEAVVDELSHRLQLVSKGLEDTFSDAAAYRKLQSDAEQRIGQPLPDPAFDRLENGLRQTQDYADQTRERLTRFAQNAPDMDAIKREAEEHLERESLSQKQSQGQSI